MELIEELEDLRKILSKREIEVVVKRLTNQPINQTESNYLSKSIRPKLKVAQIVTSLNLLSLINYKRKKYERENKIIKDKILSSLENVIKNNNIKSIILYGSYIQNKHTNYRDIDVMIILKKKIWKTSAEKYRIEKKIEDNGELNIDVNLVLHKDLIKVFSYSPLLQTELEDYELIYGSLNLIKKIKINKTYLYRKLLETEGILELGREIKSKNIYNALRTCLSIKLFLKKIVDNKLVTKEIVNNIGISTVENLIENRASPIQKEIALKYLDYLYEYLKEELK